MIGKYVLVRTNDDTVYSGYLVTECHDLVVLRHARRLPVSKMDDLDDIANRGIKKRDIFSYMILTFKISFPTIPLVHLSGWVEMLECSEKATEKIEFMR